MSVAAAQAHTALLVLALIVAVIVVTVSGVFVGLQWAPDPDPRYSRGDPAPPIVVLVWSCLTVVYLGVYFVVRKLNSYNFFVCIIMDIVFLGVILISGVGVNASMIVVERRGQWVKAAEAGYVGGGIPTVGIVCICMGWLLVAIILAILLFEVIYTLKQHGGSATAWQLSFLDLADDRQLLRSRRRSTLDGGAVDLTATNSASGAQTTSQTTPMGEVTPLVLPPPAPPPYEPPLLEQVLAASPTLLSPHNHFAPSPTGPSADIRQLSAGSSTSPLWPRDMPELKRATLEGALPEWKREAIAGPHLPRTLPIPPGESSSGQAQPIPLTKR